MAKETLVHYHINWRPSGLQPGAKRGLNAGVGEHFRAKVQLRDYPDPRRLDLRASMRDPFELLWVRDFYLNASLKVFVLIDASASMGYVGAVNRKHVLTEITAQLALSAYQSGDAFGVYAASEQVLKTIYLPPRVNKSAWLWARSHLPNMPLTGQQATGLLDVVPVLPKSRSLVFVVSDFCWPHHQYQQLLKKLHHHDVVPILLQDPAEMKAMPKRGIAIVNDMETGQQQFLWMRPTLQRRIDEKRKQHVEAIQQISHRYGVKPFLVTGQFNPAWLNQYFAERQG